MTLFYFTVIIIDVFGVCLDVYMLWNNVGDNGQISINNTNSETF